MKIRTQFLWVYCLAGFAVITMAAVELSLLRLGRRALERQGYASLCLRDVFELNLLTHELNLFQDVDRPSRQMVLKLDSLSSRFSKLTSMTNVFTINEVEAIGDTVEAMRSMLKRLEAARHKQRSEGNFPNLEEFRGRIGIQLLQRSQTLYGAFSLMQSHLVEREEKAALYFSVIRGLVALLLCIALFAGARVLQKRISKGFTEMELGALEVTHGNRSYLFSLKNSAHWDEIDTVQNAINTMVDSLSRAEDQFRQVVEASPYAMIIVDQKHGIKLVNRQAEVLFGYRREELLGKNVEILVPQDVRPRHPRLMESFFLDPKPRYMGAGRDVRGLRKNGTEFPAEISLSLIEGSEGMDVLTGILDLSESRKAQIEIQSKNRELQTLLHVISHDLKEPLRSVEYFSTAVLERHIETLDADMRDYLNRCSKGAARMRTLLDDVLILSRARSVVAPDVAISSKKIIGEVLERLQGKIHQTGAIINVAEDLPDLKVDGVWAGEAVYNLLGNALKYAQPGRKPEIEILPYRSQTGDVALDGIIVQDRGIGVDPEMAERIFVLFQRGASRDVEGTGAGLAIVKTVAERHGGKAWVEPREGGGSRFFIAFKA